MDSLARLSAGTGGSASAAAADLEAGKSPLMGEAQMVDRLQEEIKAALERLASVNDEMQQASDGSGKAANLVHRHREILGDKQSEFRRTRTKIAQQRESTQLLSSVRRDISDHHESVRSTLLPPPHSPRAHLSAELSWPPSRSAAQGGMTELMRERASILNSEREMDVVMGQAMAARETLDRQRGTMDGITDKIKSVTERIP